MRLPRYVFTELDVLGMKTLQAAGFLVVYIESEYFLKEVGFPLI